MSDRDDSATTPARATPADPNTSSPAGSTAQTEALAADGRATGSDAASTAAREKKPFYRRTGVLIGGIAATLLLLGLVFGGGYATGALASGGFDRGPGNAANFGPGAPGDRPTRGDAPGAGQRGGQGPGQAPGSSDDSSTSPSPSPSPSGTGS